MPSPFIRLPFGLYAAVVVLPLLVFAGATLPTRAAAERFEPVVPLGVGGDVQQLAPFLWFLEDASGERSLADVLASPVEFERNPDKEILNPGTAGGTLWVRVDVRNDAEGAEDFVVSLNRASVDTAEIHLVRDGIPSTLLANTDAARAASFRSFQTLAGRFSLNPSETGSLLVRFRGANWSALRMTAGSVEAFASDQFSKLVVFLLLMGGVGTLILYGSVSFVFLGRQIVLLYAFAQTALFVFFAHLAGYTTVYLWPESPESGRIVTPAALAVFMVSMAQFARVFFETRQRVRTVDRLLRFCVWAGAGCLVALPLDYLIDGFDARLPVQAIYAVVVLVWLSLPALAIYATLRWSRDFWPVAVAWTSTASFTIAMPLVFTGAIPMVPLGKNAYGVAVYVEALFLAIALALRIRAMRVEAFEAQQQLNESLRVQLAESQRSQRLSEERSWALQDLSEKGRLLLGAGHDSRQMLSALRNYAAGLRRGSDDEDVIEATHGIDEIARSLKDVLTSVVAGSSSGGIADRALALDTLTASSLLGPLQLIHRRDASQKGVDLRVHLSDRLIVTDRVLVMRVLGNLVSNAIKYTQSGRVVVALRPRGLGARFQVWDTGEGIDPESLGILLSGDVAALRVGDKQEGTGSGLGIARTVAARLGGSITARSTPGRGSVFELDLPLARLAESPGGAGSVLLCHRDPGQFAHLAQAEEAAGRTFVTAATPDAARRLLAGPFPPFDLILIDEHFGAVAGGVALAREIQQGGAVPSVVLLTHDRSSEGRTAMTDVVPMLLYKPVSARALYAARQALLRLRQR